MGKKITLRALERDDLAFVHKLNNNADIMSYWFEEPHQSMAQLEKMYDKSIDNLHIRQFILMCNDERIGFVGLFSIDMIHRKAEFGIMIDPEHQGYGYATIATNLAIGYAFSNVNLHKLYLLVDETNEKAIHIYKKTGFQVEGILKDEFFVNGAYHNVVYMSIFQTDYLRNQR